MPSLNYYLNALGRCGTLYRSRHLEDTALGANDASYLFRICHHAGESQEALARALYVSKCNVTRRLAHLEAQGYITRTPSEQDKRVMLVYPTQKALDTLPRLREVNAVWREALTADFTPEETETFELLLSRALKNGRALVDGEVEP